MLHLTKFEYDTATAINLGNRERQEDSLASNFPSGSGLGFLVLSDGMGGHASGDIASKIVVTEVFSELMMRANEPDSLERDIDAVLRSAALGANDCVGQYPSIDPEAAGMGATLLAPVLFQDRLYWISIGDSPLFLFRDGRLRKLNADHSMATHFDGLVSRGEMDRGEAETHPDRSCLTSVLIGSEIPHIDCRSTALKLRPDDIVVAASDGLTHLSEMEIAAALAPYAKARSADILASLLEALQVLDDPDQDNVALCVIQLSQGPASSGKPLSAQPSTAMRKQASLRSRGRHDVFAAVADGAQPATHEATARGAQRP